MSDEDLYETGRRRAWLTMLTECLNQLGYAESPEVGYAKLAFEREEALCTLRKLCDEFGDNAWPDEMHLGDVIEKHLMLAPMGETGG